MEELDRREMLVRAGGMALAGSVPPVVWELVSPTDTAARVDPRLRALARELRGPVYAPGSAGYGRARRVFNLAYAGIRPLGVAQPETTADVQACVRWSRRHRVRVVPRGGGHSYAGYSTGRGVLQVDLRRMDSVRVDAGSGTAYVGAGARLMQVYAGLARRGVAIPAGSCPTVGIAGLALGGGHGLASRRWGVTSDNIVGVDVVLADGRHVTADPTHHADLLWACRGGGGGSFGIVTRFRFRVHRVTAASRFSISWPWEEAEDVLAAWQRWAPHAASTLDSILNLSTGGGSPTIRCVGQYFGGTAALRRLLGPVRRVGHPSISTRHDSYLNVQLWLAGCAGETVGRCLAFAPQRFAGKSHYFAHPIPGAGRAAVVRAIDRARRLSGGGALILDAYGGAINRVRPGATAFVHRDQLFSGQFFASWGAAHRGGPILGWLRGFHAQMRPYASGYAYQNYIDPELRSWKHAYYGSNFERLTEVKKRYDPGNHFHFAQSIPPAR
jgi:FAD binding domain/Berberine and berberine like